MKQKVKAILDVHEQKSPDMVLAVQEHPDVMEWSLSALDVGDLHIKVPDTDFIAAFERKTPSDYASTLMGKEGTRLDEQIQGLVDFSGPGYILIEGNQEDFRSLSNTGINPNSLVGSVASTDVRYLDGVRFCSDANGLVEMAIRLSRKHVEDPSTNSLKATVVEKDATPFKRILGVLEGVGPETAGKLEAKYEDLPTLMNANMESLQNVDGIGEKLASSIHEQLHHGDD